MIASLTLGWRLWACQRITTLRACVSVTELVATVSDFLRLGTLIGFTLGRPTACELRTKRGDGR